LLLAVVAVVVTMLAVAVQVVFVLLVDFQLL
jgi:hypothetical protein